MLSLLNLTCKYLLSHKTNSYCTAFLLLVPTFALLLLQLTLSLGSAFFNTRGLNHGEKITNKMRDKMKLSKKLMKQSNITNCNYFCLQLLLPTIPFIATFILIFPYINHSNRQIYCLLLNIACFVLFLFLLMYSWKEFSFSILIRQTAAI